VNRSAGLAAAIVALDAATKAAAFQLAEEGTRKGPLLPVRNPKALLGLAPGSGLVLATIGVVLLVIFGGACLRLAATGRIAWWVPGAFVGGAVANLVDRAVTGAVHDWLPAGVAVIDAADIAVVVAAAGYAVGMARTWLTPRTEAAPR
jgi:lipoprotein signal peptidase